MLCDKRRIRAPTHDSAIRTLPPRLHRVTSVSFHPRREPEHGASGCGTHYVRRCRTSSDCSGQLPEPPHERRFRPGCSISGSGCRGSTCAPAGVLGTAAIRSAQPVGLVAPHVHFSWCVAKESRLLHRTPAVRPGRNLGPHVVSNAHSHSIWPKRECAVFPWRRGRPGPDSCRCGWIFAPR